MQKCIDDWAFYAELQACTFAKLLYCTFLMRAILWGSQGNLFILRINSMKKLFAATAIVALMGVAACGAKPAADAAANATADAASAAANTVDAAANVATDAAAATANAATDAAAAATNAAGNAVDAAANATSAVDAAAANATANAAAPAPAH